jgi:hypothetical protein
VLISRHSHITLFRDPVAVFKEKYSCIRRFLKWTQLPYTLRLASNGAKPENRPKIAPRNQCTCIKLCKTGTEGGLGAKSEGENSSGEKPEHSISPSKFRRRKALWTTAELVRWGKAEYTSRSERRLGRFFSHSHQHMNHQRNQICRTTL